MRALLKASKLFAALVALLISQSLTAGTKAPPLPGRPVLSAEDVGAWLDGFLGPKLREGKIAGAVVVVVEGNRIVARKGYGYADVAVKRPADPANTIFRPGSISKVVTATAAMQLVDAGKVDLDADVNKYLDFDIPPWRGQPVTLRQILTHTTGFEDNVKRLFVLDPARLQSLDAYLRDHMPARIHPPGRVPAYSNYALTLAGHIVERVSGEPFDQYVERHIFRPLGMLHSTFRQPVPPPWRDAVSLAYVDAGGPPQPNELINARPAGSMAVSADDMARFMLAQLNGGAIDGARILSPAAANLMHRLASQPVPSVNGMALGFFREDRNGLEIIGHEGDTSYFHSELHLLLAPKVGIFLSMNSIGVDDASGKIRSTFMPAFLDRYFPHSATASPTLQTARVHGEVLAGEYQSSRRNDTSFFRLFNVLGSSTIKLNDDATVSVDGIVDETGSPVRWREVAPFVWVDPVGKDRLAAVVRDGRVQMVATDRAPPVSVLQPAPWWGRTTVAKPWLTATAIALCFIVVAWLIVLGVRRWRGWAPSGSRLEILLRRLTPLIAAVELGALVAYFEILPAMQRDIGWIDARLDTWLRGAQLLTFLGIAGAVAVAVQLALAKRRYPGFFEFTGRVIATVAALSFAFYAFALNLLSASLDF